MNRTGNSDPPHVTETAADATATTLRLDLEREHAARVEAEAAAAAARHELHTTRRKLDVLAAIASIATESNEPTEAYALAMPILAEYSGMVACHVFVADAEEPGVLVDSGLWFGERGPDLDRFRSASEGARFRPEQGMVGRAVLGEPVWEEDFRRSDNFLRSAAMGTGCGVAFPVVANRQVVAVIELLDPLPAPRNDDLVEICAFAGAALGRVAEREIAAAADQARNQAMESEMARRNESLSLARRRAAVSSRAAEAFFTALSHDLKTPLHTILAAVADMDPVEGEAAIEHRRTIREAAESMITRVDHLLSLSPRVDDGSGPSEVIIASALTPALSAYREVLALQGQRLSVGLSEDTNEPVLTDSGGLLQALDSVMGRIVTVKGAHTVHIDVGFGGPELVTVVSCPANLLDAEGIAALLATELPASASIAVEAEDDEIHVRITTPARRLAGQRRSRIHRVLLVDDNQVTCRLGAAMIASLGYEVALAASGAEAIAALREQPFGLVLMDIRMPDRDGLSTTRGIRDGEAGEEAKETPIVALTANAAPGDAEQSLLAGLDGHVTKPFDKDRLAQVVATHIVSDK